MLSQLEDYADAAAMMEEYKYIISAPSRAITTTVLCACFPWLPQQLESDSIQWLRGMGMIVIGLELGVRPSSLVRLTTCCWQPRQDGSVAVQVDLAKAGKNGEVFAPY